jgi:hypothetical protein
MRIGVLNVPTAKTGNAFYCYFQFYFYFLSIPRSSRWFLSLRFPTIRSSLIPHTCHNPRLSPSSSFEYLARSTPLPCYLLRLRLKYLLHHHILSMWHIKFYIY